MISVFGAGRSKNLFRNPRFIATIALTAILIFIYLPWPWRTWDLEGRVWQWMPWLSTLDKLALFEAQFHIVGSLFLIPILYSAIFLPLQNTLIIWILAFAGVLPIIIRLYNSPVSWSINLSFLIIPVLTSLIINIELRLRLRERLIFTEREKERRLYLSKIIESQETERKRISQEIHDGTIQTLVIIANKADILASSVSDEKQTLGNLFIKDKTTEIIEELRRLSLDLRPSVLDNFGLLPALRWLINCLNEETKINASIFVSGNERVLPSKIEATIFRIIQEALNNIRLHSQAKTAKVEIKFFDNSIDIAILDNGTGFAQAKEFAHLAFKGKFGLIGIKERVESIGGTFSIESQTNKGTVISIKIKC